MRAPVGGGGGSGPSFGESWGSSVSYSSSSDGFTRAPVGGGSSSSTSYSYSSSDSGRLYGASLPSSYGRGGVLAPGDRGLDRVPVGSSYDVSVGSSDSSDSVSKSGWSFSGWIISTLQSWGCVPPDGTLADSPRIDKKEEKPDSTAEEKKEVSDPIKEIPEETRITVVTAKAKKGGDLSFLTKASAMVEPKECPCPDNDVQDRAPGATRDDSSSKERTAGDIARDLWQLTLGSAEAAAGAKQQNALTFADGCERAGLAADRLLNDAKPALEAAGRFTQDAGRDALNFNSQIGEHLFSDMIKTYAEEERRSGRE